MRFNALGKYIGEISKDFRKFIVDVLEKHNLTVTMWRCLLIINVSGQCNLNDIAKEMNVDKAMVTRSIKKLVEYNYINKVQDSKDNRAFKLYLSQEGKSIIIQLKEEINQWYEKFTSNFSEEEIESFISLMNKGYLNIKKS